MRRGYDIALFAVLLASLALFAVPQFFFLQLSFYKNLGLGEFGPYVGLANYWRLLTDPFTLSVLGRTVLLSAAATLAAILLGAPTAYWLARLGSRWIRGLITLLLVSSFVSVVVKALGLQLMLGSNGPVARALSFLTFDQFAPRLLYNDFGVSFGLLQYTLPLVVLLLFGVIQNIPLSLEEAARVHGASDWRMARRILLPEMLPGLVVTALISFNMNMGAFTSAVLLGGGRVLTMPILIQRKIMLDLDYPDAAVLCVLLTVVVVTVNLVAARLGRRARSIRTGGEA